jgi:hypothetical protein
VVAGDAAGTAGPGAAARTAGPGAAATGTAGPGSAAGTAGPGDAAAGTAAVLVEDLADLAVLAVVLVLVVGPAGLDAAGTAIVVVSLTDTVDPVDLAVVLVDLAVVLVDLSSRPSVDSGDLASSRSSLARPEGPIPRTLASLASAEGTRAMVKTARQRAVAKEVFMLAVEFGKEKEEEKLEVIVVYY